jgi:iron(III) transport system substrate-binding protein
MASRGWTRRLGAKPIMGLLGLVVLACAPAAPSAAPTGAQASPPAGPSGATSAQPAADPVTLEWERIVAAAKQEGKVVVTGPQTADARDALTQGFERRYPEIQVEYAGAGAGELAPKILPERQAGRYLTDLIVNGNSGVLPLIRANAVDPLPTWLKGPEARDTSRWRGGRLEYSDRAGQYNVTLTDITAPTAMYHPGTASPSDIKSYRDFLDPKWRGRITLFDPRVPGTGQAIVHFLYATEGLGRDYLRQFFGQNVTLTRDDRQMVDWVVRGQYSLVLGGSQLIAADLKSKGIEIGMLGDADIAEGSYLTSGSGSLAVLNQPPHPNATLVYVDWLLSREAQHAFARGIGYTSRRTDVPSDHVPDYLIPRPGKTYLEIYRQEALEQRDEVVEFLRSLLGS